MERLDSLEAGTADDSCWYKWEGVNLVSPLSHSHKAGWEKWGRAGFQGDLAALGFGPDLGKQIPLQRRIRGDTYLGRRRSDEG